MNDLATAEEPSRLTRPKTLWEQFHEFDREHPDIWELFVTLTYQLIAADRKSYSAWAVMNRVRWHYDTSTSNPEEGQFKLCNDFFACYARKWKTEHPLHADFFKIKYAPRLDGDRQTFQEENGDE